MIIVVMITKIRCKITRPSRCHRPQSSSQAPRARYIEAASERAREQRELAARAPKDGLKKAAMTESEGGSTRSGKMREGVRVSGQRRAAVCSRGSSLEGAEEARRRRRIDFISVRCAPRVFEFRDTPPGAHTETHSDAAAAAHR